MLITALLIILTCLLSSLYLWMRHNYNYWKRKGVPYVEPSPLIGNIKEVLQMKNSLGLHFADIYNHPKMSKEAVVGIYALNKPALIVRDLDLIKSILIKDFNKFSNRYSECDAHGDPLASNNLFFVRNPHWRELRTRITPVFTSGKLRQMYPLMQQIGKELESHLNVLTQKEGKFESDVKEICALFTTDVIASIAFGLQANCLKNPNAEFRKFLKQFFDFSALSRVIAFFVIFFMPKWTATLKIRLIEAKFDKFLRDTISYTITERERSGTIRNDLIDILINLKNQKDLNENQKEAFSDDFLLAQATIFLTAGFETSSSTMAFGMYELSKKPHMQTRLRNEIMEALVKDKGEISYETIHSMEYLNMVVNEVLRLYPVLPFLDRQYEQTNDKSEYSLKPHYDYSMPNGMPVYIPVYGLQRDPKYWTQPNTFDPERFSKENERNIHPMSYMPFGSGPHNCIGNRLGLLQTKMGLVHILKNHYVEACDKTSPEMILDPKALILASKDGIYLRIVKDNLYEQRAGAL